MSKITIAILSGVQDGRTRHFDANENGQRHAEGWSLSIGRRDDNDLILRHDTFVSRQHAQVHLRGDQWILQDCDSTNGTFLENDKDFLSDERVTGEVTISIDQLFRVGRTWLRLQASE